MTPIDETLEKLKERLARALSQKARFKDRSRLLEEELAKSREREGNSAELVQQLLERQRELNVMLNRSNLMLNRAQEVNSLLSLEFNEMVQALPEPQRKEKEERINRITELFKKTGMQEPEQDQPEALEASPEGIDAEFSTLEHADRRKSLWGEKPPEQKSETEAENPIEQESAQPEIEPTIPEAKVEETAEVEEPVQEEIVESSNEEPEVIEEKPKETVSFSNRGYPLGPDDDEEDSDNVFATTLAKTKIFPAKMRRWLQHKAKE